MNKRILSFCWLLMVGVIFSTKGWSQRNEEKRRHYNLQQAISDNAQMHTIAFDGLAFMTGNFGADCFFPPGKLADFFGFQYMRDNDENQLGHNTDFLTLIANNVLSILTPEQIDALVLLAKKQEHDYDQFARKRWLLIKAFRSNMEQDSSVLNKKLNEQAVAEFSADLYELDGKISYERAEVIGKIIRELTATQKKQFEAFAFNNSATWPEKPESFDKTILSHRAHVGLMTYASELFSWYKGSLEADIYFCPERHGTYFGGFYMKDFPAMDNHGYNISTALTGDAGKSFIATLQPANRQIIQQLPQQQKNTLNEIVRLRTDISTQLRHFIDSPKAVPDKKQIIQLVRAYGKLDGRLSYLYAQSFATIYQSLSTQEKSTLKKIRHQDVLPDEIYLYSDKVPMPEKLDDSFLFQ